jgi:predicted DNA-binding transcriptional regulator AlpA
MTNRTLLNIAQVAADLGKSATWFFRHRKALEEQHGFPPPLLAGGKCSMRWDPEAIKLWKDRGIPAHLRPDAVTISVNDNLAAELDARAARLAARH